MTAVSLQQRTDRASVDIDTFLKSVELKAYRIALLAVSNHADALDILQDSMLKLVSNYGQREASEWKPLFYRILHNRIKDWHRHAKVRSILTFWQSEDDSSSECTLTEPSPRMDAQPESAHMQNDLHKDVIDALSTLPEKQRQCFLLRTWEGMSVADTATAMACSQGSVKTHFFRAVSKLRQLLGEVHEINI